MDLFFKGARLNQTPYKIMVVDPQMARVLRDVFDPIEPNHPYPFQGKAFIIIIVVYNSKLRIKPSK